MNMHTATAIAPVARVEWELLPSLRNLLGRRQRAQPAWMETVPSELVLVETSEPFHEVLPGLSMREVREPDIFQIFFG